jgi:hypothetical protein
MTASTETRPLVVHRVTPWSPGGLRSPAGYDLRNTRLRIASYLLGATVANLDAVRDARSLADIQHCPACGPGPLGPAPGRCALFACGATSAGP